MTWSSEPGPTPDARNTHDSRAPRESQNGYVAANPGAPYPNQGGHPSDAGWNGAPAPTPMRQVAQTSALTDTQPRAAAIPEPAPTRAADPSVSGSHAGESGKRKRVKDSAKMPALRLNHHVGASGARGEARPKMVYDTEHAPGHLRLTRLGVGLATLVAAWVVSLLVVSLAEALWIVAPHQPVLTERYALDLLYAIGILWLAVIALTMIVVGAFSLFLALTRRDW